MHCCKLKRVRTNDNEYQYFEKKVEFQWEQIVLISLLICFYTVMNLNLLNLSTFSDIEYDY